MDQNDRLNFVMEYLRFGSEQEANEVLRRLRTTGDLGETINFLHDSSLLLQSRSGGLSHRPPQVTANPEQTTSLKKTTSPQSTLSTQSSLDSGEEAPGLVQSLETFNHFYEPISSGTSFILY